MRVVLFGNPNSGKSTVFNALTGGRERVGNWSGVTVALKMGQCSLEGLSCEVVDLPGTYALTQLEAGGLDEQIARTFLATTQPDVIVNVIDASHLERHLYLTAQLMELGYPVIVLLNMIDVAKAAGIRIDTKALASQFGCAVVQMNAYKGEGLRDLKACLRLQATSPKPASAWVCYPEPIEQGICALIQQDKALSRGEALALLEGDDLALSRASDAILSEAFPDGVDIAIADARYLAIARLMERSLSQAQATSAQNRWQTSLDCLVLNRFLAFPIFLSVIYSLFFFAINVGGVFQDFFDMTSDVLLVQGLGQLLHAWHWPDFLVVLFTAGIGKGINTTLTFIPIIFAMFFFLAFLEDSGYMARAAFVVDRLMRYLGLPGKAFVSMIVGFGCNVPAVMAARTLSNRRDRILTIMMSPFMSCSARLAIYAIFTAAFFPSGGHNIVFALYLLGILMAIATGLLLRATVLSGEESPLILELPHYHVPTWRVLFESTWQRSKAFLFRAGKVIVPVCFFLGVLGALDSQGNIVSPQTQSQSILAQVGKRMTPIFSPMGLTEENWPATVGLLTGVLAKEVVIGTLDTLYLEAGKLQSPSATMQTASISSQLKAAFLTIPMHLRELPSAFFNPVLASVPDARLNQGVFGVMVERFKTPIAAFAYLLFVLLYIPCVSTMAVIYRELNFRWAAFSVAWNTALAYGVAVGFYQIVSFLMQRQFAWHHFLTPISFLVLVTLCLWTLWRSERHGQVVL